MKRAAVAADRYRYRAVLAAYLSRGDEGSLRDAYELGRAVLAEGRGLLEMVDLLHDAISHIRYGSSGDHPPFDETSAERLRQFTAEALSPFEMALRGYQEANATLQKNVDELHRAEKELLQGHAQLADAYRAVATERRRYHEQFDFAPDGYLVGDMQGKILEANRMASMMLCVPQDLLAGESIHSFFSSEENEPLHHLIDQFTSGDVDTVRDWEMEIRPARGPAFAAALSVALVREGQGRPVGMRWMLRDITAQKRAEKERAELQIRERVARSEAESARRLAFQAKASTLLAGSLDHETTLKNVARLVVPFLADLCFVDLVNDESAVTRLEVLGPSSGGVGPPGETVSRHLQCPAPPAVADVLASGEPALMPRVSDDWLQSAVSQQELATFRDRTARSAIIVPLVARGRTIGAITMLTAESGVRYDHAHFVLARDLAYRCALAVDNARLYREGLAARDRAETANRAKERFLAVLSHELRNPLMPILGWARALKGANHATVDLSEAVSSIERNAQIMTRLLGDCLDLSRIEEGKIAVEKASLDLNEVARAAMETTRKTAVAKGLEIALALDPSSLPVLGDRTRLAQVLMNLLSNAVKYTDPGGTLRVATRALDEEVEEVELLVSDTGHGIDPEQLRRIFEPFRRGDRWLGTESGLGLGLAIAEQIVLLHGGRIWAESDGPGRGSRFFLRLPRLQGEEPRVQGPVVDVAVPAKPLRILVVEDSRDIRVLLEHELTSMGYSVLSARHGKEGVALALRERPDVIVCDIRMPVLDGLEVIRKIRGCAELANTAAIALTGFGMKKDVERALAGGFDAHLTKPVDAEELARAIRLVEARRAEGSRELS